MEILKSLPENLWQSPVIRNRLQQEALFECDHGISHEKPHYWCLVPFADSKDGTTVLRNFEDDMKNCDPHEMQQEFARQIMTRLQREAHFDGLWLVGFTHPPTAYGVITDTENCWNRLIAIWFDSYGDPQYTLESDLPFMSQLEAGEDYYVGLAYQSHEQWNAIYGQKAMKEDMMLKDDQMKAEVLEALK